MTEKVYIRHAKYLLMRKGLMKKRQTKPAKKGGAKKPKCPRRQRGGRRAIQTCHEFGPAMAKVYGCGYGPEGDHVPRHPDGHLQEMWGPAEKDTPKGAKCHCLSKDKRVCKKHPSREKVRTGRYIKCNPGRKSEWALKGLVDAGYIKIKENAKFRVNKFTKRS